jgi:hypothetical protein
MVRWFVLFDNRMEVISNIAIVRFVFLIAVLINVIAFWDMKLCELVYKYKVSEVLAASIVSVLVER